MLFNHEFITIYQNANLYIKEYTLCCTIALLLSHLIIFSFVYEHRIDSECTYIIHKTNGMPFRHIITNV